MARMRTKTTATALETLPPAPVSRAREGRDEQHMNAIPKKERQPTKMQNASGRRRFALSSQGASIGLGPSQRAITGHCCSAATAGEGRSHRLVDSRAAPE